MAAVELRHAGTPEGACACDAEGFISRLECGCEVWSHGEPSPGQYITCNRNLAHQSSYKVIKVRAGRP